MNFFAESSEPTSSDILYINFNQESTALSVGTKTGYKLYTLQEYKFEPDFVLDFECITNEDVCIVERHFLSSLVVLVKLSSPRRLIFYNFKTAAEIAVKHFSNTILAIKLNRKVFVVCLEDSLHIFDILEMSLKHVITKTPSNPRGLCALTVTNDSFLAYPGSSTNGDIQIFDASKLLAKNTISAHNSPIVAMAFSHDGTKIASASETGTVIRVFDILTGKTLFDFRRGIRSVTIYSLTFSLCSEYLSASSNTETVHIFKLEEEEILTPETDNEATWLGSIGRGILFGSAKYLPSQMSDVILQMRSFATVYLPFSGLKNISCIPRFRNNYYVFVASSDGFLYSYLLKPNGGICTSAKQHRIDGSARVSTPQSDNRLTASPDINKIVPRVNSQSTVGSGDQTDDVESDDNPPLAFSVS